jgi:hypothetical protein
MDAAATIDSYVARSECGECGYDGELIVEMGGGLVSVTCPACGEAASARAAEVGPEWEEFCAKIDAEDAGELTPKLGYLASVGLFIAALIFGGVLEP